MNTSNSCDRVWIHVATERGLKITLDKPGDNQTYYAEHRYWAQIVICAHITSVRQRGECYLRTKCSVDTMNKTKSYNHPLNTVKGPTDGPCIEFDTGLKDGTL